jgi:DNA polymerase alpha subunit A
MKELEVSYWPALGRLRINRWPTMESDAEDFDTITYQQSHFMAGRLVCDTFTASKNFISSKSYHLSELASSQLHIKREDINTHKSHDHFDDSNSIIELAKHCSFDAFLSYALMDKLRVLPLTKQLTNVSGNLWSRSINRTRSGRNEYFLLHNFYNKQFICPDKVSPKGKRNLEFDDEELELEMREKKKMKETNNNIV